MDPRWRHPFTAIVAGPTKCGKTHFVERFINSIDYIMYPTPTEIIWCYGIWQPGYENLKRNGVIFLEGIPSDINEWCSDKRRLCILDDSMDEVDTTVTKLLTKGAHHHALFKLFKIFLVVINNSVQLA